MTPAATNALITAFGNVLDGYEQMRALVIKSAAAQPKPQPQVVLEKVATVVKPASVNKVAATVDTLISRGFVQRRDREATIRELSKCSPNELCDQLTKYAALAVPLQSCREDQFLEPRDGESRSEPSQFSSSSNRSWLEAAKAKNP